MKYFSQEFIDFFQELEDNNSKEWFDENRKRYEEFAKKPFKQLVQRLLDHMIELDTEIQMLPKDAIFRINRDIRFSKDKTPYNTIMKAGFARGGRKSPYAGYYLGISASKIHVGGGVYMLDSANLKKIREHIATYPEDIQGLAKNKYFQAKFGEIQGDRLKRIPKEYQELAQTTPWIANKNFYYMTEYNASDYLTGNKLFELIWEHFELITPLNRFLKEAINS